MGRKKKNWNRGALDSDRAFFGGQDPDYGSTGNSPIRVKDRYRRGTRRWSFFIKTRKKSDVTTSLQWYTITRTQSYGPVTYSCNCADYSKQAAANPGASYVMPTQDFSGNYGTPRVFPASSLKSYKSSYYRYSKGVALVPQVIFSSSSGSAEYYKIYSSRNESFTRNWAGSDAGTDPGQWCKHIWAVVLYRGDPFVYPSDMPEYGDPFLEDLYAGMESEMFF